MKHTGKYIGNGKKKRIVDIGFVPDKVLTAPAPLTIRKLNKICKFFKKHQVKQETNIVILNPDWVVRYEVKDEDHD